MISAARTSPTPLCRHGDGDRAVARFSTPQGCACFPEDREQDLCAQHIVKWGVHECDAVLAVYIPELAERLGVVIHG